MGFFDDDNILTSVKGCGDCFIQNKVDYPDFPPLEGEKPVEILVVDEMPHPSQLNDNEWNSGQHFEWLLSHFNRQGMSLDDAYWVHAKRCRCSEPSIQCRGRLQQYIRDKNPRVVFLCGDLSISSVIGQKFPSFASTSLLQGNVIPDQEYGCWLVPTYGSKHADAVKNNPVIDTLIAQDISRGLETCKKRPPKYSLSKCSAVLSSDEASLCLDRAIHSKVVSIDFETTGLKPQMKGHKILTVGIGFEDEAIAFVLTDSLKQKVCNLLTGSCRKLIYNLSFECVWAKSILGVDINNIESDVMLQAHMLDGRSGILSLDKQLYLHLGISSWDAFDREKKSNDVGLGTNGVNSLETVVKHGDVSSLLEYNAKDCLATMLLWKHFKELGL